MFLVHLLLATALLMLVLAGAGLAYIQFARRAGSRMMFGSVGLLVLGLVALVTAATIQPL